MERSQIIVIAAVVAALGLFGLKFLSGSGRVDPEAASRAERQAAARGVGDDQGFGGPAAAERRSRSAAPQDAGAGAGRTAADPRGGRDRHAPSSSGSSEVLAVGEAGRGGASGVGGGVGRAAADSAHPPQGQVAAPAPRQIELGERSPSDPAAERLALAYAGAPEPDEQGVVLSVPLQRTTEAEGFTQPIAEENLKPAADGTGIDFAADSILIFPDAGNVRNEQGTISLDIEPHWHGADPGDNSFVQIRTPDMWHGPLSVWRNGRYLRFNLIDAAGLEYNVGADIESWAPGERYTVTVTWGEALMSMYIDGQLVGQTTYSGELVIPPGTPLYVGSNPPGRGPGARATLQNLRVYARALSVDEVVRP